MGFDMTGHWPGRRAAVLCAAILLVSACAATRPPPPEDPGGRLAEASAANAPSGRGFLGFLRRPDPAPADLAGAPSGAAAPDTGEVEAAPGAGPSMTDEEIAAAGAGATGFAEPSRRPRLFGGLFRRVPGDVRAPRAAPPTGTARAAPEVPPPAAGVRLFGGGRAAAPPDDATGALPFGDVARVCGLARRNMGTEVARSPGRGTYRLFDSSPNSVEPRTQYLTGFRDGCARRFTASLALFGSAAVHEATRYNPLNQSPYSATDEAYESVKARICRVGRGQPCPDRRAARLERDAAFVSVYRGFGDTALSLEMFLYKGDLVSSETRTR